MEHTMMEWPYTASACGMNLDKAYRILFLKPKIAEMLLLSEVSKENEGLGSRARKLFVFLPHWNSEPFQ